MKVKVVTKDILCIITLLSYNLDAVNGRKYSGVTSQDMIKENGYPAETHIVRTEDGYFLTMYRIPGPLGSIPVFLQHGVFLSSADFLHSKNGLAYILSNKGYDVWLGNARGTTFSKKHMTLSSSDPLFWDFSWHDLGVYDIPASIMYIFNVTKQKLFYVGHSMGSSSFAVMASERPEFTDKIRTFFAVAPVVYNHYIKQPVFKNLAPFWKEFQTVMRTLSINEFLGRNIAFDFLADHICTKYFIRDIVCNNIIFFIGGFDPDEFDSNLSASILSKLPSGTSVKLVAHWFQQMRLEEFRMFDHGPQRNLAIYNSTKPPNYNLFKMEVPVAVFYSDNDWITSPEDALRFYKDVPNKLGIYKVDHPYSHFDFLWGLNASTLVYPTILELMARFS